MAVGSCPSRNQSSSSAEPPGPPGARQADNGPGRHALLSFRCQRWSGLGADDRHIGDGGDDLDRRTDSSLRGDGRF